MSKKFDDIKGIIRDCYSKKGEQYMLKRIGIKIITSTSFK